MDAPKELPLALLEVKVLHLLVVTTGCMFFIGFHAKFNFFSYLLDLVVSYNLISKNDFGLIMECGICTYSLLFE